MRKIIFAAFLYFLAVGCAHVKELPTYERAMQMGGPDRPKLFYSDTAAETEAAMMQYALITQEGTRDFVVQDIWHKAAEIKADVVIIRKGDSVYAGSYTTAVPIMGFGAFAVSTPMYTTFTYGDCYRLQPSRLGIRLNPQTKMILSISNDSVRSAGIIEGDTLMAINGHAIDTLPAMLSASKLKEPEFNLEVQQREQRLRLVF